MGSLHGYRSLHICMLYTPITIKVNACNLASLITILYLLFALVAFFSFSRFPGVTFPYQTYIHVYILVLLFFLVLLRTNERLLLLLLLSERGSGKVTFILSQIAKGSLTFSCYHITYFGSLVYSLQYMCCQCVH